ncbi:MAG: hypothetical protein JW987_10460 [Anaerolineaceae bacterium]|nr:hypothetical protein [Anaerolineaceae bacterium]
MQKYILPLSDLAATLENVGGKGMSLSRLVRAGLPVPDGFHVTTAAYRDFVEANRLQQPILAAMTGIDLSNPAALEAASVQIRELFEGGAVPMELAEEIRAVYAGMGTEKAVAVRSSATAEDLPDASFAGQQDTYLNIHGVEAVLEAVKRCWGSLWTARAIGYRARQGIDPDSVALAVVVQELVAADAAGVMFTANPVNGNRNEVLINATWGLGEALVSGAVTPDTLTVEKAGGRVLKRETANKQVMTVRTENGTEEQPVAVELQGQPVLNDAQAAELCALGVKIETHYGMPMDVEWTLAGDRFAIVQARPITALPDEPLDWTLPNPKSLYMRASVVDLLPVPVSPLFESMGIPAMVKQMVIVGQELMRCKPMLPDDYFTTLNRYGYMNVNFPFKTWWWLVTGMIPAYPRMLRILVPYWRDVAHPQYQTEAKRFEQMDFAAQSINELWSNIEALVETAMTYVITLMYATMGAAAGAEALVTKLYKAWARKEGDPPAETLLMGWNGLSLEAEKSLFDLGVWIGERFELRQAVLNTEVDVVVKALQTRVPLPGVLAEDWAAFSERFEQHLRRFGYIIFQLDFAADLPADHPEPMIESLKMYLRGEGANPHERQRKSEEARQQLSAQALSRVKGLKGWIFRKALNWGQAHAEIREDALAEIGLGYPALQSMFSELGGRMVKAGLLAEAEDIYWLQKGEIQAWVAGLSNAHPKSEVVERKDFDRRARQVTPPPMIPLKKKYMGFDSKIWIAESEDNQKQSVMKGAAAGGGKVTARACVLHGPEDFGKMKPGDVLVAGTTTPAWTPLFAMASAVVTDIGGPLSHGSIVAREYGIPAVMGTGVATRRIQDGQIITVDGDNGLVVLKLGQEDAPVAWTVEDKVILARGSLAEHTPGPVSPLFATLGLRIANVATEKMWVMIGGEKVLQYISGGFYRTVNQYVYGGFRMTAGAMWHMSSMGFKQMGGVLKTSSARWQKARQAYQAAVEDWEVKELRELSGAEIVRGIEHVFGETVNYYTVLQSGPLPASSVSEIMLDRVYRMFIKRKQDPEARIFLYGFDTQPLKSEKSLYDLSMWVREHKEMQAYVGKMPVKSLAEDIKNDSCPEPVTTADWEDWKARFARHQAEFGRTSYGLDFMEPTPIELPELQLETIQQMAAGATGDPYERQRQAVEQREKLAGDVLRRTVWPIKGWFKRLLRWAQETAPTREDGIADLGLGYPLLRRLFGELGRRFSVKGAIDQAEDIYGLEEQEVLGLIDLLDRGEPLPDLRQQASRRLQAYKAAFKLSPPVMVPEKTRWSKLVNKDEKISKEGRVILVGTGTSGGNVTARACVVLGPEDFEKMKPGDILVAVTTTPAWTPLFTLASAVVTDIGGPLSHSSIVAREYGIPAVMAVRAASRRIQDGQIITVDGNSGTVTL